MNGTLGRFETALREGRYYDAHEITEDLWRAMRRTGHPRTLAVKGLINGAVALELFVRGRPSAARKVWPTYQKYRPLCDGSPTLLSACLLLEELYATLSDPAGSPASHPAS